MFFFKLDKFTVSFIIEWKYFRVINCRFYLYFLKNLLSSFKRVLLLSLHVGENTNGHFLFENVLMIISKYTSSFFV